MEYEQTVVASIDRWVSNAIRVPLIMILTVVVLSIVLECNTHPSAITTNEPHTESQYRYDTVKVILREHTKTENVSYPIANHTLDLNVLNIMNAIFEENQQSMSRNFTLIPGMDVSYGKFIEAHNIFRKPTNAQTAVEDTSGSPNDRSQQIELPKRMNKGNNSNGNANIYLNQPFVKNSNNRENYTFPELILPDMTVANDEKDVTTSQPMPLELNIFKGDDCPSGFTKISDRCVKVDSKN